MADHEDRHARRRPGQPGSGVERPERQPRVPENSGYGPEFYEPGAHGHEPPHPDPTGRSDVDFPADERFPDYAGRDPWLSSAYYDNRQGRDRTPAARRQRDMDEDYLAWRAEQIRRMDEEYEEWRRDRRRRFAEEYESWRRTRSREERTENGEPSADEPRR